MSRKGITPIIAIIILLLITVALAGAAWTFLSGFLTAQTEKSFLIPNGGAFCAASKITLTVVNVAPTATLAGSDFILLAVSNSTNSYTMTADAGFSAAPGKADFLLDKVGLAGGAGNWPSGTYTIDVGTSSAVLHYPIVC